MTPQDHNKVIGIMHLIYGGFNALMLVIFVPIFFAMGGIASFLHPRARRRLWLAQAQELGTHGGDRRGDPHGA